MLREHQPVRELTPGWNLINWSMPTSSPEETPIRASINFEPSLRLSTDRELLDVHERYFVGFATVFGIPFSFLDGDRNANANSAGESDAASKPAVPKLEPIAELVARLGAVSVETPKFKNTGDRVIEVENEVPDFRGSWGAGFDIEMNVPVARALGYLTAHGTLNFGFDPNPWTLTLGYTLPISQLGAKLVGNGQ
jgi:hypothetical protein